MLLIGYGLLMLVPFAWTVDHLVQDPARRAAPDVDPEPIVFEGWETAFTQLDPALPRLFLNSLIVAGAVTLSNVTLGTMAGYAFARLRFPGREVLFIIVIATLMIPDQLRLVPVYILLNNVSTSSTAARRTTSR